MLTRRVRRGQDTDVIRAKFLTAFTDVQRLDAVEQLIPLAQDAGVSMPHLAMAFAICHPPVTSALLGARTIDQLDDLIDVDDDLRCRWRRSGGHAVFERPRRPFSSHVCSRVSTRRPRLN
jgi:hypothetical protein